MLRGCLAALLFSIATWSAAFGDRMAAPPGAEPPARIVVKLRDGVDVALDATAGPAGLPGAAPPAAGLAALNARFGVRSIRTLRRVDALAHTVGARLARERARRLRAVPAGGPRASWDGSGPTFVSTYVLELPAGVSAEDAARAYAADPDVAWAQPDRVRSAVMLPDDPFLSTSGSWGQDFADLWGVHAVRAPVAWDVATGSGVVIAVVDTGVDTTHPDLQANLWVNPGEVPGNGIDDDANGYVDDVHGWNVVAENADVEDDHGHGTHVAGTAAAVGDNGVGIVGIAPGARIMALKGLSASGIGYDTGLADAIVYAAENGARVLNASWGAFGGSPVLDEAIEVAHAAGVVVVAAAGNDYADLDVPPFDQFLPAMHPHAVAVAAVNHLDGRAGFSNFGTRIDVAAPGGYDPPPPSTDPSRSVLSLRAARAGAAMTGNGVLVVGTHYVRQAGTSMATPHVAGAAAVVLSAHPGYGPEEVRQALRAGAHDVVDPGWDPYAGHGRLDVAGALAVDPLAARITSPRTGVVTSTAPTLAVRGSVYGAGLASYGVALAAAATPDDWSVVAGPFTAPVADDVLATLDMQSIPDGAFRLRVRAVRVDGTAFEDRVAIQVDRVALTAPRPLDTLTDTTVQIRGSIAPAGLHRFVIEYSTEAAAPPGSWRSAGVSPTGGGLAPVEDGVLATFDATVLGGPSHIAFRAVVETTSGSIEERVGDVIIDPTLRPGWPVSVGWDNWHTFSPTIADLDGDGVKEILIASAGGVGAFRPDGTFAPGWPQPLWNDCCSPYWDAGKVAPAAADLDGDGRLEVALNTDGKIFLFEHDGTLVPGWPVTYDVYHTDCTLVDVDGDALPEVLTLVDHEYDTGGNLRADLLALERDGSVVPGYPIELEYGEWSPYLAVGDVTGDGVPELAMTRAAFVSEGPWRMYAYLFDLRGVPLWPKPVKFGLALDEETSLFQPWVRPTGPVLADVDRDGVLDVVLAPNNPKKLLAYRADRRKVGGALRTGLPPYRSDRRRNAQEEVSAGDVSGDGAPELVVATNLTGDPRLESPIGRDYVTVLRPGARPVQIDGWPLGFPFDETPFTRKWWGAGLVSIGDIDGDGAQDIVLASKHCERWNGLYGDNVRCFGVQAFRADGTPVPGFPKPTHAPTTRGDSQAALADLDGDGRKEVVWLDALGRLFVWNVAGNPTPEHFDWPMLGRDPAHRRALPPGS